MQRAWIQWGGAAAATVLALLMGAPIRAADNAGVRPVAEELGQRTKPAAAPEAEQKGGLSDSAVRVLMTYALSIIPDTLPGPDGKPVKVDKNDPNKFVIPVDDARRIVRVATRSAYAEVCDLHDLERANLQTLLKSEEAKKTWSRDQMLLINALHMFSVSYFTGSIKITTTEEPEAAPAKKPADGAVPASKSAEAAQPDAADAPGTETEVVAPKRPTCSPEQKVKVTNAINAYVLAAKAATPSAPQAATAPQAPPAPAAAPAPATGGSN